MPLQWARTTRSPAPVRGPTAPSTPPSPHWRQEAYPKAEFPRAMEVFFSVCERLCHPPDLTNNTNKPFVSHNRPSQHQHLSHCPPRSHFIRYNKQLKGVGATNEKELKIETVESPHTLGGAGDTTRSLVSSGNSQSPIRIRIIEGHEGIQNLTRLEHDLLE